MVSTIPSVSSNLYLKFENTPCFCFVAWGLFVPFASAPRKPGTLTQRVSWVRKSCTTRLRRVCLRPNRAVVHYNLSSDENSFIDPEFYVGPEEWIAYREAHPCFL